MIVIEIDNISNLNLNRYRNTHYFQLNKLKRDFEALMTPKLRGLKLKPPIKLTFEVYKSRKINYDLDNIVIAAKFFNDALKVHGCIPDDGVRYIDSLAFLHGGYGKEDKIIVKIEESK